MAITLSDNLLYNAKAPVDARYYNPETKLPWATEQIAKDNILVERRYVGLTVAVSDGSTGVKEYWWKDNTSDLVKKEGATYTNGTGITITNNQIAISSAVQITDNLKNAVNSANAGNTAYYPTVYAVKTYVDGIVTSAFNDRGNYAPSLTDPGPYPSAGGSGTGEAIMAGDFWTMSRNGYLLSVSVATGSSVRALVNTPGQDPANWAILNTGIGYLAENTANKVVDGASITNNASNTILYPSVKAVKDYVTSVIPTTPGLTTVLGVSSVATNKGITISSQDGTDYKFKVENTFNSGTKYVEIGSQGVKAYSTSNAETSYQDGVIYYKTGGVTYTLNLPTIPSPGTTATLALAGSNSLSAASNAGINITSNEISTTYDTSLVPATGYDPPIAISVGQIGTATSAYKKLSDIKGKSIVQIFDAMFFPVQNPTYTIPKIEITGTGDFTSSKTLEVGTYISGTLRGTGTRNDAGTFSAVRIFKAINGSSSQVSSGALSVGTAANIANQFGYPNPNNDNNTRYIEYTETASNYFVPDPATGQQSSTVVYSANGDYPQGAKKQQSDGNTDPDAYAIRQTDKPQAADNNFATTSNITITGLYPTFSGTYIPDSPDVAPSAATIEKVIEAKPYSASSTYAIGDYTFYNNKIYRCKTAILSGQVFTPANWDEKGTRKSDLITNLSNPEIVFGNTGSDTRYWFVAQPTVYDQKTLWSQKDSAVFKNVSISTDFNITSPVIITSPDYRTGVTPLWTNVNYRVYISKNKNSALLSSQIYYFQLSII